MCAPVPSAPTNVTTLYVTSKELKLKWHSPLHPNGLIRGYRIFIHDVASNRTEYRETSNGMPEMEYEIGQLSKCSAHHVQIILNHNYNFFNILKLTEPFTRYRFWLKAFTSKHMGNASEPMLIRTDVQAPLAPRIVNLSCSTTESLFVQ